jgi:hypothetical protein
MVFYNKEKQLTLIALAILGFAASAGCQRDSGRQAISGAVTLDGRPAAGALLHFQPLPNQPGSTSGAAADAAGHFCVAAAKGLLPGRYAVNIQKWEKTGRTFVDARTKEVIDITAPIPFKEDETLTIAVIAGGPNHFDFKLTSLKTK